MYKTKVVLFNIIPEKKRKTHYARLQLRIVGPLETPFWSSIMVHIFRMLLLKKLVSDFCTQQENFPQQIA